MAARVTLVLGGQRSGKSRYAETVVAGSGRAPIYLATATAGDAEMAGRIARHRDRRGTHWSLVEEPVDLAGALTRIASPHACVLVDCLTLWVSNLLGLGRNPALEGDDLLSTLARLAGPVVFVSNEVGSGIIPATELGRRFADDLGTLNQRIAAVAADVVLLVAGLPLHLKKAGG
jgi:adenosylcobinamide kinase/adenosylcobinamide-phosphate guanylyltransferase